MNIDTANRIRQLLQERNGGNGSALARHVGVSSQAVQQWLAGTTAPRGKNLHKAADYLNCSPAYISYGSDDHSPPPFITNAENDEGLVKLFALLGCNTRDLNGKKLAFLKRASNLTDAQVDQVQKILDIVSDDSEPSDQKSRSSD